MIYKFKQEILDLGRIPYIGKLKYENGDFVTILYHLKTEIFKEKMPEDILTGRIRVYATCEFSENDYIVISNGNDVDYFVVKNDEMVKLEGKYELLRDYTAHMIILNNDLLLEIEILRKAMKENGLLKERDTI